MLVESKVEGYEVLIEKADSRQELIRILYAGAARDPDITDLQFENLLAKAQGRVEEWKETST